MWPHFHDITPGAIAEVLLLTIHLLWRKSSQRFFSACVEGLCVFTVSYQQLGSC